MTAKFERGPFQFMSHYELSAPSTVKIPLWPRHELIKYAVFLNFSQIEMQNDDEAFSWSFLRKMSLFVQTRNPNQCRIFHKKMMEEHGGLTFLIADIRGKIDKFEEWIDHYEPSLRNMKQCLHREIKQVAKQPTTSQNSSPFDLKEKQALAPTSDQYLDDIKVPKNQVISKPSRKSFGFESFGEESSKPVANDFDFYNRKPIQRANKEEWLDCQRSFTDYFGKLTRLMAAEP